MSSIKKLIQQCSVVILGFDSLEELHPLTTLEFNFRKIVKLHYEDLLKLQFIYWKQRCTIRYIKVGEENSIFFHAMATERLRRNSIASLRSDDDVVVTDHDQMAGMLWASFKNRMGQAQGVHLGFNLEELIYKVDGLDDLTQPFTAEEIAVILKDLPTDRAPGPDGFNGLFVKKCWSIIEKDFL